MKSRLDLAQQRLPTLVNTKSISAVYFLSLCYIPSSGFRPYPEPFLSNHKGTSKSTKSFVFVVGRTSFNYVADLILGETEKSEWAPVWYKFSCTEQ